MGETVLAIPEGRDYGRGRMFLRIGTGQYAWTGSFARGLDRYHMSELMPDGEHLFIAAAGAGYIIDASSRTLVEEVGRNVVRVLSDRQGTLFVVIHDYRVLEAFDRTGRLWITCPIGSGGLRNMNLIDHALTGEARHPTRPEWIQFRVSLATGEVRFSRTPST